MSERKQALVVLKGEVNAGKFSFNGWATYPLSRKDMGRFDDAYSGSLDAAKALHGAVLPDMPMRVNFAEHANGDFACTMFGTVAEDGQKWTFAPKYQGLSSNPARSWLIAILEALIAKEDAG
jgi:hypothetical protein